VRFSSDGKLLISGRSDGTLRIWDVASGRETRRPGKPGGGAIISVDISPDDALVLGIKHENGCENAAICIGLTVWNAVTGDTVMAALQATSVSELPFRRKAHAARGSERLAADLGRQHGPPRAGYRHLIVGSDDDLGGRGRTLGLVCESNGQSGCHQSQDGCAPMDLQASRK
jgi:hypothetical protein